MKHLFLLLFTTSIFAQVTLFRKQDKDALNTLVNANATTQTAINSKEDSSNKTNLQSDATSTTKFPTFGAVNDFVTPLLSGKANATAINGTLNFVPKFASATSIINSQILDNGTNVGIGTLTPIVKLDVLGNAWIGVQKGTSDAALSIGLNILNITSPSKILNNAITTPETALRLFRAGTASVKYNPSVDFQIGTHAVGINALTKLNINLGNNASSTPDVNVMTLQGNGNVGIGTSAPIYRLDVNSNVAGTGFGAINAGYGVYRFGNSGGNFHGTKLLFTGFGGVSKLGNINGFEVASGSNMMSLGSGANENILNIASSGNVGIGTLTPNSNLHVIGTTAYSHFNLVGAITLNGTQRYVSINTGNVNTVTLPAANTCVGRVYTIVNRNNTPRTIGSYRNFAGTAVTDIPANSGIELISDGALWLQMK